MKRILIQNARVIDPAAQLDAHLDILVRDGCVALLAPQLEADADVRINAAGYVAAPGLIDLHVHLRDPGQTEKEDLHSACCAAAAGGVTTLVAMPNTAPAMDSCEVLTEFLRRAAGMPLHILQAAAISKGLGSAQAVDFTALAQAGAAAFSDDGRPVENTLLLLRAYQAAAAHSLPVLAHCEDALLAGTGIVNEAIAAELGVPGIPAAAEDVGTAREIALAMAYHLPVHICHVSTRGSVALIRAAKQAGAPVTAETAPHYISFDETVLRSKDANFRMNPPLRGREDREALIQGLQDGTLDAIATDHAPHTAEQKADFNTAPNGVIGMETSLAACLTDLVNPGHLTLAQLLQCMSTNPARILKRNAGTLREGCCADIVLFDPDEAWTVDPAKLHGKSRNTPYAGRQLTGKVKLTIAKGEIIYSDTER